jgi:hypothetical protein
VSTVYYADNYQEAPYDAPGAWPLVRAVSFKVATAFILGDTVRLMTFPGHGPGVIFDYWELYMPVVDSGGGSSAFAFELGDVLTNTSPSTADTPVSGSQLTTSATRYLGSTAPAAGAATQYTSWANGVKGATPFSYSQLGPNISGGLYDLVLTVATAPNTGATGVSITGIVGYHMAGATPTV